MYKTKKKANRTDEIVFNFAPKLRHLSARELMQFKVLVSRDLAIVHAPCEPPLQASSSPIPRVRIWSIEMIAVILTEIFIPICRISEYF